jgi:hypothetical protein
MATALAEFSTGNARTHIKRVMESKDALLPKVLRGLESILSDQLLEGTHLWDFVQHTQRTLQGFECVNTSTREQVSAVNRVPIPPLYQRTASREKIFKGRIWLLCSLNTQSLLDSTLSIYELKLSYYSPHSLLCTNIGWSFITAMLKQLHTITFRLSLQHDVQFFDQVN